MYSCNVLKYLLSANLYVAVVSGLGIITQLKKFALFAKTNFWCHFIYNIDILINIYQNVYTFFFRVQFLLKKRELFCFVDVIIIKVV